MGDLARPHVHPFKSVPRADPQMVASGVGVERFDYAVRDYAVRFTFFRIGIVEVPLLAAAIQTKPIQTIFCPYP